MHHWTFERPCCFLWSPHLLKCRLCYTNDAEPACHHQSNQFHPKKCPSWVASLIGGEDSRSRLKSCTASARTQLGCNYVRFEHLEKIPLQLLVFLRIRDFLGNWWFLYRDSSWRLAERMYSYGQTGWNEFGQKMLPKQQWSLEGQKAYNIIQIIYSNLNLKGVGT